MPAPAITESGVYDIVKQMVKKAMVQRATEILTEYSSIEATVDIAFANHLYNFAQDVLDNPDLYIDKAWELILFVYPTLPNAFIIGTVPMEYIMATSNPLSLNIFQSRLVFNEQFGTAGAYNTDIFFHLSNYYND